MQQGIWRMTRVHGFTIVELLVVLAIMLIIAALIMTGIMRYSQHQEEQQFATEVTNALAEARAKTLAGLGDTTYGVYIGTSTIEYFSGSAPVVGSAANTIIEIPSYIFATSSFSSGAWYVTFARLSGMPSASGTIDVVDTRTHATTTITVFETGLVQY